MSVRLQRKCSCGGTPSPTGECAECRRNRLLQPKLVVNQPRDRYEREADRVAEQVMRAPEAEEPTSAPLQIQRVEAGAGHADMEAPPVVHEALRAPGQPLDAGTRSFMESRFGHDFSRVRVHVDAKAAESARAVEARAYTVGQDVVLGGDEHQPQSYAGKRLLAHELTHVLQQEEAMAPRGSGMRGIHVSHAPAASVQRDEIPAELLQSLDVILMPDEDLWYYLDLIYYTISEATSSSWELDLLREQALYIEQELVNRDNPPEQAVDHAQPAAQPQQQATAQLILSQQGLDFTAREEGEVLTLYDDGCPQANQRCGRGHCTIGVGHLVHYGPCTGNHPDEQLFVGGINQAQSRQLLQQDVVIQENAIRQHVTVALTQNQYDALVSYVFNTGSLTGTQMLRNLNNSNFQGAAAEMDIVTSGGVVVQGLVNRRARERGLFLNGNY